MVDSDEDRYAVDEAVALDGLQLDLMPIEQARRLGRVLAMVVDEWRAEIRDEDPPDMLGLGESLDEVGLWLHDYDDGDWPAPPNWAADYPALAQLFNGYLSGQWREEYGDLWAAVADFVAREQIAADVGAEVDRLLAAGHDEHRLVSIVLLELKSGYGAVADGWPSFRVWLAELARRVRALLDSDDGT